MEGGADEPVAVLDGKTIRIGLIFELVAGRTFKGAREHVGANRGLPLRRSLNGGSRPHGRGGGTYVRVPGASVLFGEERTHPYFAAAATAR
jgi:hypothetical protein